MTELGNLTACILLRLWRKSTVKIRAGSLFRTPQARIGAIRAAFQCGRQGFPPPSTGHGLRSQDVHRKAGFPACAEDVLGCKVEEENLLNTIGSKMTGSKMITSKMDGAQAMKAAAGVCRPCEGTGWKTAGLGQGW